MPSSAVFVGRNRELESLQRKLEDTISGSGSVVVLSGEAGAGKTRIASEFARRAGQRGAKVLRGSCFEGDWQPPYAPWVDLLGEQVTALGPEWLLSHLGTASGALTGLIPHTQTALPEGQKPTGLSPDVERFRLYDAFAQFFLALAREAPVVLLLDDLQWAGPDSLRLLRHVSRLVSRCRLLLVGAYRYTDMGIDPHHPLRDVLALLQLETDCELIAVRGLAEVEIAEYLAQSEGIPAPGSLVQSIFAETGGNPFYLREVLRHMDEEGMLPGSGGHWPAALDLEALGIPEGVRQVIDRRVARLSEDTRLMLRQASGFTGAFEFPVLQDLTGLSDEALLISLDEALQAGFLTPTSRLPPAYAFSHAIVRQTIYSGLNPDRRVRLHRRIGVALERAYAGREIDRAAELASQYHASASLPGASKAVPYALAAAEQARARHAYEQSAVFLNMARDLSAESTTRERADLLCRLAIAQADAVLLDAARATVEEALEAMSAMGMQPAELAGFLWRAAREMKESGASAHTWEPLVDRGLALAGDRHDLLWARLTVLKDRFEPVSSGGATFGQWLGHDSEAVTILRRDGAEDDYSQTLESSSAPSRQETEAIFDLARGWQRPSAIMAAIDAGARDLFYRHGAFIEAADRYRELLEAARRYGSLPEQAEALAQLAVAQAVLGDLEEARRSAVLAHETIDRLGPDHGLHFMELALNVMLAYYLEGDWSTLEAKADRFVARQTAGRPRHPLAKMGLVGAAITSYVHCRAGNSREALRHLAAITPAAERMGALSFAQNSVVTICAGAVWELGAAELATPYRRMALDLIAAGVGNGPVGPHQLAVARMAALEGEVGEAEKYFVQARLEAEAAGLRPSCALTDFDEALALLRSTPATRHRIVSLLDSASNGFRKLGMEGWEKRALDLRARTGGVRLPNPVSATIMGDGSRKEMREFAAEMESLTDREREVVALLASGLSNAEIASRLVISIRTAEAHVASILSKLGFTSRTQVVVWAVQCGFGTDASR